MMRLNSAMGFRFLSTFADLERFVLDNYDANERKGRNRVEIAFRHLRPSWPIPEGPSQDGRPPQGDPESSHSGG